MTHKCTLKESFVEKQLDKFQPKWRMGEDITSETKQKIRDYVVSKLPKELKDDVACITDYSIWHMAQKIRKREGLTSPMKTNKGRKVSVSKPDKEEQEEPTLNVADELQKLIREYGEEAVIHALKSILKEVRLDIDDVLRCSPD